MKSIKYKRKIIVSGKLIQQYDYIKPISSGYVKARENYEKATDGEKHYKSLNRARNNMVRTINSNITKYSKFITLTVKENITDRDIFLKYFKNFRRNFKNNFNEPLKYLGVLEQQKRGAWHIHLVVFNNQKLDFQLLKKCWTVGSVDIKLIDSVNNIGRYLAKYLTKEHVELNKKAILKSRNLKKPIEITVLKDDDLKMIASLTENLKPHFMSEWVIMNYEYYITKDTDDIDINKLNQCRFTEYIRK